MSGKKTVASCAVFVCLLLAGGCNLDGSDGGEGPGAGPAAPSPGTYAGTWIGKVCGRGLTMHLTQNGLALSGDYSLTDPDFGEGLSGSVNSATPPASAVLHAGGNRRYELDFESFTSFSGGFYKGADRVCEVRAARS